MPTGRSAENPKLVFAPGCALVLYKPELVEKLHNLLNDTFGEMELLTTCCRHDPKITGYTRIINVCTGCDKRFAKDYKNVTTISLWEILAESKTFPFPDYNGRSMSINDACPSREKEVIQISVRTLLERMNITLKEPKNTRTRSICCGDSFYGEIPTEKVIEQMIKRANEMPETEVAVYCVSCIKSVFIGGKKPKYLIDLLYGEETEPKTYEPDAWHIELTEYIDKH